jgi:O-antigen ligase
MHDLSMGVCLFLLLIYCTMTVFVKPEWAVQSFQIGLFALLAIVLLLNLRQPAGSGQGSALAYLIYLLPLWGIVQILAHTTASTWETREAVLRWGALAAVFYLTRQCTRTNAGRTVFLSAFAAFATAMAVLCLAQRFTSGGRVFWIFSSGYDVVFATFPSPNSYTQFVELALPIALWRAIKEGWRSWGYPLAGAILFGSVVAASSRAGTVICLAEMLAILALGLVRMRHPKTGLRRRSMTAVLFAIPLLAVAFTLDVGWQPLWGRLQQNDPYAMRREFFIAAAQMAIQRPGIGYGLGTFPEVYQQFAVKQFPVYANHAHNDWAEFAAEGGLPFLLLVLIPCVAAVPAAIRHPWGLGFLAILLHACVDFPFPRLAVSVWIFAMLALLLPAKAAQQVGPAG